MKTLILLAGLLLPIQSMADGFVNLQGNTSDGWALTVDTELPYEISISKKGKSAKASTQKFTGEHCKYEHNGDAMTFSCTTANNSPLSGTSYIGHPVESCEVSSVYVCVAGCIKNNRAPLVLTQGFWQGASSCGLANKELEINTDISPVQTVEDEVSRCRSRDRSAELGVLIGDRVNLRDAPHINAKILRTFVAGTTVKKTSLESGCEIVGGKGGIWVAVEVGDGETNKVGFIFDSKIKYHGE